MNIPIQQYSFVSTTLYQEFPKRLQTNPRFIKTASRMLDKIDSYSLENKIKLVGRLLRDVMEGSSSFCDETIKLAKLLINGILNLSSQTKDKIEMVNVFYSSIIKHIKPEDLIKGDVSPKEYLDLINESIKNYKEKPLGQTIDYRHIAGRMVTLKNMCKAIIEKSGKLPMRLQELRWTDDMQLDYLAILEKIAKDYDGAKAGFKESKGFLYTYMPKTEYTEDIHKEKYEEHIKDLMLITLGKIRELMRSPRLNREEIENKLEIAYAYFDKIPYNHQNIDEYFQIYNLLRIEENKLIKTLNLKLPQERYV